MFWYVTVEQKSGAFRTFPVRAYTRADAEEIAESLRAPGEKVTSVVRQKFFKKVQS